MKRLVFSALTVCFLSISANANELQCFTSANPTGELEVAKNKMGPQPGFAHLKGQNFYKKLTLRDKTKANVTFQLRSKGGTDFDFRIQSDDLSHAIHLTAALDRSDMFQYSDYGKGIYVICLKDLENP